MEQKKRAPREGTPMEKAMALTDLASRRTDPAGSYTGQPRDGTEIPQPWKEGCGILLLSQDWRDWSC